MKRTSIIRQSYDYFAPRSGWLYGLTLVVLLLCIALFLQPPIRADIRAMLPEGRDNALAEDFDLLQASSLSNKIFITLHAERSASRHDLIQGARLLTDTLRPPHFDWIDPASIKPDKVMEFLLTNGPNLLGPEDLKQVRKKTHPDTVKTSLEEAFRQLTSPQGVAMKRFIRLDPLGFRTLLAPRLQALQTVSEATIVDGYLFSRDGRSILLSAASDIPLTDADGADRLVESFQSATSQLPTNIQAQILSGHLHTRANATTIKNDLTTISLAAAVALGLLFVIFFRSSQAFGVFVAPLAAMGVGLGALGLFSETISAIVIGFGAVLIGISVDFAMHVYFAIARRGNNAGHATSAVARPIIFCTLTSCAAFGALFLSGMPGIRQLALFSMAGLVGAAVFSLFILPHLSKRARTVQNKSHKGAASSHHPATVLTIWSVTILAALWLGGSVSLDPDLRNIGYMPDEIRQAEAQFQSSWGEMRNRAIVFAQGDSPASVLGRNENVYRAIREHLPDTQVASLAPLMPGLNTQSSNRAAWTAFWTSAKRNEVMQTIAEQGEPFGFSSKAFTPFQQLLKTNPPPITPPSLDDASLGLLKDIFMPESDNAQFTLVTMLPDSPKVRDFFTEERESELGVRLISNQRFKAHLESTMKDDIKHFIIASGLAVVFLSFILFRNTRRACLALLPPVSGVIMVFAVLGVTGTALNLFHITALPLIIGLGADYGIFLASRETQLADLDTTAAVKVSGLTTLAGFGVLVLARHPSLHSLGVTVLVGIGSALVCALYVMPHLLRRQP